MAKTKKREPIIIAREEWDFSPLESPPKGDLSEKELLRISTNQIWICWLFEYSREFVKEGGKFPIELKDLFYPRKGFPNRPFLDFAYPERVKIERIIPSARGGARKIKESSFMQDFVKVLLFDEVDRKAHKDGRGKNTANVLLSQLKQLGVYRLLKAGNNIKSAMECTTSEAKDFDEWLSRTKWRSYQREARRRIENWPSTVIPPLKMPLKTEPLG